MLRPYNLHFNLIKPKQSHKHVQIRRRWQWLQLQITIPTVVGACAPVHACDSSVFKRTAIKQNRLHMTKKISLHSTPANEIICKFHKITKKFEWNKWESHQIEAKKNSAQFAYTIFKSTWISIIIKLNSEEER